MTMAAIVIAAVVCVLLSGFFSGAETGAYCVNAVRLRLRCEEGEGPARRLRELLDDQPGILSTTLIGTNIANYLATACLTVLMTYCAKELSEQQIEMLATAILVPIIFVFGEVVPKNWFRQQADDLMPRSALVLWLFDRLFTWTGAVPVLKWLSARVLRWWHGRSDFEQVMHPRREIAALLREGVAEGIMSAEQSQLIDGVLKLSNIKIGSVMIPYFRVQSVPHDARRQDILHVLQRHAYSRYVVMDKQGKRVAGIIDVYEYMADPDADDIGPYIAQPMRIGPDASVFATLYRMREARQTFGVVVDKWDNCIGVVTVKDLVEEVVGELHAW